MSAATLATILPSTPTTPMPTTTITTTSMPTTVTTTTRTTTTTTQTNNNDLVMAKCLALIAMLLCTLLAGSIPHLLNHYFKWTQKAQSARSSKIVQCLLHFGGGVLLATIFIHLLPEVQEIVRVQQLQQKFNFHLPETLMCLGFILMYLIDEALHAFLRCRHLKRNNNNNNNNNNNMKTDNYNNYNDNDIKQRNYNDNRIVNDPLQACTSSINTTIHGHGHADIESDKTYNNNVQKLYNNNNNNNSKINRDIMHQHQHQHNDCELPVATEFTVTTVSCLDHCHSIAGHSHLPRATISGTAATVTGTGTGPASASACDAGKSATNYIATSFRGLFIVLGLSLHEIFEGLAIGLEDDVNSVWFLFAAVSAHKLVLAFCVGVELLVARTKCLLIIIYSITFAIVSPIGIAVGIMVTHDSTFGVDSPVSVILQGLACGTLLYVVFFEILSKHRSGLLAFAATLIGFCVMFGIQQMGHSHEHDHGAHDDCLMHAEHKIKHHQHHQHF